MMAGMTQGTEFLTTTLRLIHPGDRAEAQKQGCTCPWTSSLMATERDQRTGDVLLVIGMTLQPKTECPTLRPAGPEKPQVVNPTRSSAMNW